MKKISNMFRTINPIGQGAFYTEQFYNQYQKNIYNIIYDCGSATEIRIVERNIDKIFNTIKTIDIVFISHLHDDQN